MIRDAVKDDMEAIRDLLRESNSTPYDIARVVEEKCFAPGYWGESFAEVDEEEDELRGICVTSGRFIRLLAVHPRWRRRGIGTGLLHHTEKNHKARTAIAEPGNYFTPGVISTDTASVAFFRARGYIETRWTYNLDVELAVLPELPPGATVRRATLADRGRLLRFTAWNFGRVWRYECEHAFEGTEPKAFLVEADGQIAGFSVHDVNNRGLGFFGPTGVREDLRGHGFGRQLLLASLADLRRLGYTRAVIPWTEAIDFYRKSCGAQLAGRFIAFAKESC